MSDDIEQLLTEVVTSISAFEVMGLYHYFLFILLSEIVHHGSSSPGHLHLKIYVPDIVDHHLHTKTVVVHLHKPALKKPKSRHKQYHQANWSSWSSYGQHHGYKGEQGDFEHSDVDDGHDGHQHLELKHSNEQKSRQEDPRKRLPLYAYHKDSYLPQPYEHNNLDQNSEDHGKNGYSYAVHEDVKDVPPNVETFSYNYEEGYRKGLHSESGHVHADQSSKFHEDQHEEQDDGENDGFKEDFDGRTDAGRYLVDDVEYENTRDKREGRRKLRRIHKV